MNEHTFVQIIPFAFEILKKQTATDQCSGFSWNRSERMRSRSAVFDVRFEGQ